MSAQDQGKSSNQEDPPDQAQDSTIALNDSPGPTNSTPNLTLDRVPDIPLLKIASFMSGDDLLKLTQINTRMFHLGENHQTIWKLSLEKENISPVPQITSAAKFLVENGKSTTSNVEKMNYLLHKRTRENWLRGNLGQPSTLPSDKGSRVVYQQKKVFSVYLKEVPFSQFTLSVNLYYLEMKRSKIWNISFRQADNKGRPTLQKVHIFDNVIIVLLSYEALFFRQIFAFKLGKMVEQLWHMEKTSMRCITVTTPNSFVVVSTYSDQCDPFVPHPFVVQVFNPITGSLKYVYNMKHKRLHYKFGPVADGNWIVFGTKDYNQVELDAISNPQLFAINTKEHFIKQSSLPEVVKKAWNVLVHVVKDDHLGIFTSDSLHVWNLLTGMVVTNIKFLDHPDHRVLNITEFCPKTDTYGVCLHWKSFVVFIKMKQDEITRTTFLANVGRGTHFRSFLGLFVQLSDSNDFSFPLNWMPITGEENPVTSTVRYNRLDNKVGFIDYDIEVMNPDLLVLRSPGKLQIFDMVKAD